jgi:uridine kinase
VRARRFLLFCDVKYLPLYDIKIFINVSKEKCKERRFGYNVLPLPCFAREQ